MVKVVQAGIVNGGGERRERGGLCNEGCQNDSGGGVTLPMRQRSYRLSTSFAAKQATNTRHLPLAQAGNGSTLNEVYEQHAMSAGFLACLTNETVPFGVLCTRRPSRGKLTVVSFYLKTGCMPGYLENKVRAATNPVV